ncbi:MAG: hypothetical protein IPI53_08820 [Saprospiraceae bacterium]|nr:hypothetical protein [Saprospiraceae bacterium]
MPELKIGFVPNDNNANYIKELLVKKLNQWKLSSPGMEINAALSEVNNQDWVHNLLSEEKDVICVPFSVIDNSIPHELKTFALFSMEKNPSCIYCSLPVFDQTEDLRLKKGSRIGVNNPVQAAQIKHLNPDVDCKVIPEKNDLLLKFESGELDAFLSESNTLKPNNTTDLQIIPLHPDEFIENTGSDKLVLIAHRESEKWMKMLYPVFHEKILTVCSNVERTISKHFGNLTNHVVKVRCTQDHKNFFHVKAVMINQVTSTYFEYKMSQSTHHQIAEKMINVLSEYVHNNLKMI